MFMSFNKVSQIRCFSIFGKGISTWKIFSKYAEAFLIFFSSNTQVTYSLSYATK